ncbi:MAG: VanZ family protein [Paludibacteraceae bacterium]|jgi:VanZ family protein|nr:VanZ family protein [Paludibacteraceae bacterium]MEE0911162.1 VanZ family protein [Paludibacteraceae bacterium]
MLSDLISYKYSILFSIIILCGCIVSSPPDVYNAINVNIVVYEDVKTHEVVWLRAFQDTLAHICLYFCLTLLVIWEYRKKNKTDIFNVRAFFFVVGVPLIYGILIEFLQEYLFPPRSAEILDVCADLLGCLVAYFGALCYFCILKRMVIKT